jgi:hypothetical protein
VGNYREHRNRSGEVVPLLPLPTEAPPDHPPPPDLRITFRISGAGPPGAVRGRRLLKYALRALGLRNISYEEIERPDAKGQKG